MSTKKMSKSNKLLASALSLSVIFSLAFIINAFSAPKYSGEKHSKLQDAVQHISVTTTPDGSTVSSTDDIMVVKGGEVIASYSTDTPDSIKNVIIKFREKPLIKHRGKSEKEIRSAASKINAVHSNFESHISNLENSHRAKRGLPKKNIKKILKRKYKHVFNGAAAELSKAVIEEVKNLPYVEEIYTDIEVKADLFDSVPVIGADQVWSSGYTGSGIVVSVIDTGIDYTHIDFGGHSSFPNTKIIDGYDFINGDNDPMDDHGHGTHVSGIVAADGIVTGVAYDAQLMAFKVLNSAGFGVASEIISAIEMSADPDNDPGTDDAVDIINLSLGGGGDPDDPMSQAVDNAVNAGIVVVVSAGNSGPSHYTVESPGAARKALTVGSADKTDLIASTSSRGPVIGQDEFLIKPDVLSTGVSICSSQWADAWSSSECLDTEHTAISGTSMAAPHVAGVAALMLQKNPLLSPDDIKSLLAGTAIDTGEGVYIQGSGRINAAAAINAETIISPASLSLGNDDTTLSNWSTSKMVEIKNLSSDTGLYTYSISDLSSLPPGITVTVPASVTLDELTGTGSFNFDISVDNSIVPNVSDPSGAYEGILLITNGVESIELPFAFVKTPVLTINFNSEPLFVLVHNRNDLEYIKYNPGTTYSIVVSEDTYDIIAIFGMYRDTIVVREDIAISNNRTINISSDEAVYTYTLNNLVDHNGSPMNHSDFKYNRAITHIDSGYGYWIKTHLIPLNFSALSSAYIYDWAATDTWNQSEDHFINGYQIGMNGDVEYNNNPLDYKTLKFVYNVDPSIDELFMIPSVCHLRTLSSVCFLSHDYRESPLVRNAQGIFTKDVHIMPKSHPDSFIAYTKEDIYKYEGPVFDFWEEEKIYVSPYIFMGDSPLVEGYMYSTIGNPVFSIEADEINPGMGPHFWSGKTRIVDNTIWISPSSGTWLFFYLSQWGDARADYNLSYTLYDEYDVMIDSGIFDYAGKFSQPFYVEIPLPSDGIYKLEMPYDGYYFIREVPGSVLTTVVMDSTQYETWPPYLQDFRILSDGQLSDDLSYTNTNEIKFDLIEYSLADTSLLIKHESAVDWTELTLSNTGDEFSTVIPQQADEGFYLLKLFAEDSYGNSITMEMDLAFYYSINRAPVLDPIADITVNEGDTVSFSPTGSDPDGDTLTYTYSGWMGGSSYTTDYDDAAGSPYTVTVSVSDGSLTDSQDVTVIVNNVNRVPILDPISDITVNEGDNVSFSPTGSDPDGDALTFTYSGWMTSSSYTTDYDDAAGSPYTVTVSVSDGSLTDSQDVTVIVNNVNRTPVLDPISDITVNEGDTVSFSPTGSDPDGDALTYTYSGWMTSSSYTTDYDDAAGSPYTVTVTVSDGSLTDSQDVTVTVNNVNRTPVLDPIADITVNEGDNVSFSPTGSDPDGDALTFTYSGWMTSSSYTTDYDDDAGSPYTVTVTVSDGFLTDSQDVTVTVNNIVLPPTNLTAVETSSGKGKKKTYRHNLGWDMTADAVEYSIYIANSANGPWNYLDTASENSYSNNVGSSSTLYFYIVQVFDGTAWSPYSNWAGSDGTTGTIGVLPPVAIITTSMPDGNVGSYYEITLQADGGNPPYTWTLNSGSLPDGLALDSDTGLISGTPTTIEDQTFSVQVRDTVFVTDEKQLMISIGDVVPAPAPPENLSATSRKAGKYYKADLTWDANTEPDLAGYKVYRSISQQGGPYSLIQTINDPAQTTYTDNGLSGGTQYYYVITAFNDNAQESGYSNEIEVVPGN